MEAIMAWIIANWEMIAIAGGILLGADGLGGILPDRFVPYIGLLRRIVTAMQGRKKVLMLFLLLPLISCTLPINISPEVNDILQEGIGRRLGYYLATKNPEIKEQGIKLCSTILESEEQGKVVPAIMAAGAYLKLHEKDPLLAADIQVLFKLVTFDPVGQPVYDLAKVRTVTRGLKAGLELAK